MDRFDRGVYIERLGVELTRHDAAKGERLKELALRVAVVDVLEKDAEPQAVLREIRDLASQINGADDLRGA